ncbi:MAG TPA: MFS transporter [Anaerolineae bacterium]|nr:MFS transporter [Anaerolineae bacterium]
MLSQSKILRGTLLFIVVLYGVELLDEFIYGLVGATLPTIKTELALTYTQVGLLFTLPGLIGVLGEPFIGLLGDTRHRRVLVLGGIVATTIGLTLIAGAQQYLSLILAQCILYVASGAYVNLSQATLIDRDPRRAENTMARWVAMGAIGVTISPLLITVVLSAEGSWRAVYLITAIVAGVFAMLLFKQRFDGHAGAEDGVGSLQQLGRNLLTALRSRTLIKWVILTELADFMLDKLLEVTGLYFHDVAGVSLPAASAAVTVATIAGLIGNFALVPLLEKINGVRVLRTSAVIAFFAYAAFLLIPIVWLKYVLIAVINLSTSGWFAVLRAKCYEVLPGQSGVVVAVTSLANISSLFVPLLLGGLADALGLQTAMWLLIVGPIALIWGVR